MRDPELHLVTQVRFHRSRVERENHFSQLAGHSAYDAVLTLVGFLLHECTLLGNAEPLSNQLAQLSAQSVLIILVLWISLAQLQHFATGLVELHEIHTGPSLKHIKVPVDGSPALQCVDCPIQLSVTSKHGEGAFNPTVLVTDKNVDQ